MASSVIDAQNVTAYTVPQLGSQLQKWSIKLKNMLSCPI